MQRKFKIYSEMRFDYLKDGGEQVISGSVLTANKLPNVASDSLK
jgi:hypothetical protein